MTDGILFLSPKFAVPELRPLLQITGIAAGRRCFQVREVCLKGNGRSPRRPHAPPQVSWSRLPPSRPPLRCIGHVPHRRSRRQLQHRVWANHVIHMYSEAPPASTGPRERVPVPPHVSSTTARLGTRPNGMAVPLMDMNVLDMNALEVTQALTTTALRGSGRSVGDQRRDRRRGARNARLRHALAGRDRRGPPPSRGNGPWFQDHHRSFGRPQSRIGI
jgi:hypothetical protein